MNTFISNQTDQVRNYNDFQGLHNLKSKAAQDQSAALDETAQQFEAMFIQMMLKEMRKSIPKEGLFDSHAVQTYQDMADKQTAMDMAKRGEFGIAQVIKEQLTKQGMAVSPDQLRQLGELNKPFDLQNMVSGTGIALEAVKGFDLPENRQTGFLLKQQQAAFELGNQ